MARFYREKQLRWFSSKRLIAVAFTLVSVQGAVVAALNGRAAAPLLSELIQLALGLICILACIEAFGRSRGIARYAWRLLALTFIVWIVAQGLGVYLDLSGNVSLESLDDLIFFLSAIPFGMLPFLDPEGEPNHFDKLHILDFVQVCIFWVTIFLCFSPRMWSPATAFHVGHFTWSRSIAFDCVLVGTFVLRALLTKSKSVRSLFGRMAIFLVLSGLADSYALSPRQDLQPGGWFDLIWSILLVIPILIAATWKTSDEEQLGDPTRSQSVVVNQVFPLLYPVFSFFILFHVDRAYPLVARGVFAMAFTAVATRVLIIQQRQRQSEERLRLDVAERKRTEEALRQSEVEYRLLFDSSPIPMWVFDVDTLKFLAVNEATVRHYGFSRQEFLRMTIADIRPEEDIPHLRHRGRDCQPRFEFPRNRSGVGGSTRHHRAKAL